MDPYTNQQIASSTDSGTPSTSATIADLIEEAVVKNMDGFTALLQDYFYFCFGRRQRDWSIYKEVGYLGIPTWTITSNLREKEYQLDEIIEFWLEDNVKSGAPTFGIRTNNQLNIEQVKIPLFEVRRGKERALDARGFVSKLARYLRKNYGIESKINTRGTGSGRASIRREVTTMYHV